MKIYPTLKQLRNDLLIATLILFLLSGCSFFYMIRMPNVSFQGLPPTLTPAEQELLSNLKSHVSVLAGDSRGRNYYFNNSLIPSQNYILEHFQVSGHPVSLQEYRAEGGFYSGNAELTTDPKAGESYANIEVEFLGISQPAEIIIVGAHYDSIMASPGANDNASGVAALLELARLWRGQTFAKTVRLVAFVNEEPPFFKTAAMGSLVYANRCAAKGENIIGMIALETIGYFTDTPGSQHYPPLLNLFYPDQGNFIGFVSNLSSRAFLQQTLAIFRQQATIPSEGAVLPAFIPGIDWSDHWSFGQHGYPAIMITDTAPYRYPYYHTRHDTPEKINYEKMTRVVKGVQRVVEVLGR